MRPGRPVYHLGLYVWPQGIRQEDGVSARDLLHGPFQPPGKSRVSPVPWLFGVCVLPSWRGHSERGRKGMEPYPEDMQQMSHLGTFKEVFTSDP